MALRYHKVLAFVESSPIPVATPHVTAAFYDGRPNLRERVGFALEYLRQRGLVVAHPGPNPYRGQGHRKVVLYWSRP